MRGNVLVFKFKTRGYPDSAVTTGKHRAQQIHRETALKRQKRGRVVWVLDLKSENPEFNSRSGHQLDL